MWGTQSGIRRVRSGSRENWGGEDDYNPNTLYKHAQRTNKMFSKAPCS